MATAAALRQIYLDSIDSQAKIISKYENAAKGDAYRAEMANLLLEAEVKDKDKELKKTKDTSAYLVQKLQVEQDESVPVLIFTATSAMAVGVVAGQAAQAWMKTNYPDSTLAKYATVAGGTAIAAGTVLLEQVTDEDRAKGLRPDAMTIALGVGVGAGLSMGAGKVIYDDYRAANP